MTKCAACGHLTRVEEWPVRCPPERTDEVHVPFDQVARWPASCEACGVSIDYADTRNERSAAYRFEWRSGDQASTVRKLPVGAIYECHWMPRKGPDGRALVCVLPNGHHWHIDSRANNCGLPADDLHRCWVRHGEPPDLTVDKNGLTCPAGAGSIQSGDWHGFLRGGYLVL